MDILADLGKWAPILAMAGIYSIFAIGLQVQVGHAGLDNFGQVGFMLIGAYSATIVVERHGWPLVAGVGFALAVAVLGALAVAVPTLRLRGDFLAITAIAFGEILRNVALNERELTDGAQGLDAFAFRVEVVRPFLGWARDSGWDLDREVPFLFVTWTLVAVVAIVTSLLLRTPWGRVLRAVREDEDAVRALGKNAFLMKAQALALGAAWGALAGVLYASYQVHFSPVSFEPIITFIGFIIVILAGVGSIWGTILLALLVQALLEGTRYLETPFTNAEEAALRYMVVGAVLMLMVMFRPQGVFGRRDELAVGE